MSGPAFRALIGKFVSFYANGCSNPHWGGRIAFPPFETLSVGMVSYGVDRAVRSRCGSRFSIGSPPRRRITG